MDIFRCVLIKGGVPTLSTVIAIVNLHSDLNTMMFHANSFAFICRFFGTV